MSQEQISEETMNRIMEEVRAEIMEEMKNESAKGDPDPFKEKLKKYE